MADEREIKMYDLRTLLKVRTLAVGVEADAKPKEEEGESPPKKLPPWRAKGAPDPRLLPKVVPAEQVREPSPPPEARGRRSRKKEQGLPVEPPMESPASSCQPSPAAPVKTPGDDADQEDNGEEEDLWVGIDQSQPQEGPADDEDTTMAVVRTLLPGSWKDDKGNSAVVPPIFGAGDMQAMMYWKQGGVTKLAIVVEADKSIWCGSAMLDNVGYHVGATPGSNAAQLHWKTTSGKQSIWFRDDGGGAGLAAMEGPGKQWQGGLWGGWQSGTSWNSNSQGPFAGDWNCKGYPGSSPMAAFSGKGGKGWKGTGGSVPFPMQMDPVSGKSSGRGGRAKHSGKGKDKWQEKEKGGKGAQHYTLGDFIVHKKNKKKGVPDEKTAETPQGPQDASSDWPELGGN